MSSNGIEMKVVDGFHDLSLKALCELDAEVLGSRVVSHISALVAMIKITPEQLTLLDRPIVQWTTDEFRILMKKDRAALHQIIGIAGRQTPEAWVDMAFALFGLSVVPYELQKEEYWFSFLSQGGSAKDHFVADHLHTEAFWLRVLDYETGDPSVHRNIPQHAQTAKLLDRMLDVCGSDMEFLNVREDLLTDRVAGILMKTRFACREGVDHRNDWEWDGSVDEEIPRRGARWLLDNGHPSTFEIRSVPMESRTPRRLMNIFSWVEKNRSCIEHFLAFEELRRYPQEELVVHLKSDWDFDLFKQLHGVEVASRLLKPEQAGLKRKWIEQEFGL